MSEISYFQQYSQKENHITNNTLLMFRHLYRHSVLRFEGFLKEIIGNDYIDIGLIFEQQIRAESSVPDGMITQQPLNIYIEAKADGVLYPEQIKRHIDSIKKHKVKSDTAIIIGLCRDALSDSDLLKFEGLCIDKAITFVYITYNELVLSLDKLCPDYETDLQEIIDDYTLFLKNQGMLPNPFNMVVFPCGTSKAENVKFSMYYEGHSRPSKAHASFVGIYNNKKITHFGRLRATAICYLEGDKLIVKPEHNTFTNADKDTVRAVIENTPYYDLKDNAERYYMIDDLQQVDIIKSSSGGIRGHRYFDLQSFTDEKLEADMTTSEIAMNVMGQTFE